MGKSRLQVDMTPTARRERAIAEAADKIHRPIDLETVLRTAVEEVSRITGAGDVSIRLGVGTPAPASSDDNGH
jgi:hypothetical protein